MMKIKKTWQLPGLIAVIACMAITLTACSPQQDEAYLISHPTELNNILSSCRHNINKQASATDPECLQAKQAYAHLIDMFLRFQASGQGGFGEMIMSAEIYLAQLNTQLKKASRAQKSALQQQINQQWGMIHTMWALIAALEDHQHALKKLFHDHPPSDASSDTLPTST